MAASRRALDSSHAGAWALASLKLKKAASLHLTVETDTFSKAEVFQ